MKITKPSIHFSISEDKRTKLKQFATNYRTSMNACVLDAVDLLFEQRGMDAKKYRVVNEVLDRYFAVPKVYTAHAFLTNLYVNAKRYPTESASYYWDNIVYKSPKDKTNLQVYTEVTDEIKRCLGGKET